MRAVVTGGAGFLGSRIAQLLCARGDTVRIVVRRMPAVMSADVDVAVADIRERRSLERAFAGADVVFHAAARTGLWGPAGEFAAVNVDGTRAVIAAARAAGAARLIYTSTPSVVGYARDIEEGARDLPHASRHGTPYAASKAEAERQVCAANSPGLATVALRPHLIFGPGDRALLPRVAARAARGRLRIVGTGRNRVDLTYVDNAAWAHLDAADALSDHKAPCAGQAYFISNDEPVVLWEWLSELLAGLRMPPPRKRVARQTARAAGATLELLWLTLRLPGEPPVTRFLADALARSHWYDMRPARDELGYYVRVPMAAATASTIAWLAQERPCWR